MNFIFILSDYFIIFTDLPSGVGSTIHMLGTYKHNFYPRVLRQLTEPLTVAGQQLEMLYWTTSNRIPD